MSIDYKIVATDLDGTLFNTAVEVSKENLAAIQEMDRRGVYFVPSSGRTYTEIPDKVLKIPEARYVICADGATVYDQQTKKIICSTNMNKELSKLVLDMLYEYQTLLTVRYEGLSYVDEKLHDWDLYDEYRLTGNYKKFIYEFDRPIPDFKQFCYDLPSIEMICVFFKDDEEQAECRERLLATGLVQVAASEPYNLEVFDIHAGKGNALLKLADYLGVDRAATIGVGDSLNDMNNIEKAGLGLAMANACDALKEKSNAVICHNDEHAMKYILENFIK